MSLKIYNDSENYTAQVVRIRSTFPLTGLDNLVGVSVFGNVCLVAKDYPVDELYVFVPAGCVLSEEFLKKNSLYREPTLNDDPNCPEKGYFEAHGRVKAVKFRGNISSGVIFKLSKLRSIGVEVSHLKEGDEFNEVDGVYFCQKYVVPEKGSASQPKKSKLLDNIVDKLHFPEHDKTRHLLKELDTLKTSSHIALTIKLHGTSCRCGFTLTKRKLSWLEKIAQLCGIKIQKEEYNYVVGSRHVVKSVGFKPLSGKNHFIPADKKGYDLWTRVSMENFAAKLLPGEVVYFEIIGRDYNGKAIQSGYTYGLNKPDIYVYRISHVMPNGIEVDLSWRQLKARCNELGVKYVPELFNGTVALYCIEQGILSNLEDFSHNLQNRFMDIPSILDNSVIEEGIVVRQEVYPKPHHLKLKAPKFLLYETKVQDEGIEDLEEIS